MINNGIPCTRFRYVLKTNKITSIRSKLCLSEDKQTLLVYNRADEPGDFGHFEYKYVMSRATCKITDIRAFSLGGKSEMFSQIRKYILKYTPHKAEKAPFYSWNCISLQFDSWSINLVI